MILPNYNMWKDEYIELFLGEELCPWCEGTGLRKNYSGLTEGMFKCRKCHGEGKIDWITNIMRK